MLAALPMYPFAAARSAFDELWARVRANIGHGPDALDWAIGHLALCERADLLCGQTCGWPLAATFSDRLDVVGTLAVDVPDAADGFYQSLIIRGAGPAGVAAVNDECSLSGWVSLCAALGRPADVVWTGAHVRSVEAVARGRAGVAAIDSMSWQFIVAEHPEWVASVEVVDRGPRIPCVPLVTRRGGPVQELRSAFADALTNASLRAALRVQGFVPMELADFLPVLDLLRR